MSEPKRDDLMLDIYADTGEWINSREATDADLAAMGYVKAPQLSKGPSEMLGKAWAERNGYVKLEGIDVEALREAVALYWDDVDGDTFLNLARQVLAALDGEEA